MANHNLQTIQTNNAPAAIGPYAQAIRAGSLLFTSGQIPLRPDGSLVEGTIVEQATQVLNNLQAVLEAAGSSLDCVIKTTIFIKDMNQFTQVNEVYGTYFQEHRPARSTVEVARLPKDVLIEIEAVAVV